MYWWKSAAVAAVTLALFPVLAQSPTANIVGRVEDATGAVIPGAKLTVRNQGTGESRRAVSGPSGDYTIANLAPATYDVSVEKEGFRRLEQRGLTLEVDQTARLDLKLQVGGVSEVVEVSASVPLLNTESAMKGDVVVSKEMVDIPLNGRDFGDLAYLVPGVGQVAQGGQGSPFAVNGARADNTNFIIDGFNDQSPRGGGIQARPPLDAMMEFKMQTTGYSAEYGRLAGGTMNMVLKTGTNKLHGTLFEFLRNDVMDARSFFDPDKTKLRRNQFGAVLDGPVYIPKVYDGRNRTFFLFNWEGYRQSTGSSRLTRVPTMLERQGNFTQSTDVNNKRAVLVDPLSGGPSGACAAGKVGYCFPGNIIPAGRLDSIARQVMAYYPEPNSSRVNNYYALANDSDAWDNILAKADQRMRGGDNLSFRFLKRFNRTSNPFSGSPTGLFGTTSRNNQSMAGLSYTLLVRPTLINEARVGLTRTANHDRANTMGRDYAGEWGLQGSTKDPEMVGFPLFTVTDIASLGNAANLPVNYVVTNYQWSDTLTWVKGRHLIKFGADILRTQFFQPYATNNRGTYNFNGSFTTVPIADMELGVLNQFTRTTGTNPNYLFITSYGAFAQDDFKVAPSLTLNVGMRYELPKPPVEKYGRLTNLIPELGKLIIASDQTVPNLNQLIADGGLTGKVALASDYGLPRSMMQTAYKNFAPRFGFAWRPGGGSRTVLRGGYGIFYGNNPWLQVRNDLGNVYPFSIAETRPKTATHPEYLTLQNPLGNKTTLDGVLSPAGFQYKATPQYLQSWNLTVEREIGGAIALEVAYIGSKGTHLGRQYNINMPFRRPELVLEGGKYPRPIAGFNDIGYYGFGLNSSYNAGMVTLRKRLARGFFYRINYVYSKSIDYASQIANTSDGGYAGFQDVRNFHLERARSDWDRGHSLTTMFMYQLPLGRNRFLSRWEISGTGRFQSGPPFTVRTTNVQLDQGEANRPDRIAKGTLANPGPEMWYDRSAFPLVPSGTYHFGTSGRNILDGPGLVDFNTSLMKRFVVRERFNIQFRCEAFNVLNRPNFNLPNPNVNAAAGGTITNTKSPRLIQLGLRIQF